MKALTLLAFSAQPRYATNSKLHLVSLGLAAGLGKGYAAAPEAEPVLLGRDSTTPQLTFGIAIQKQVGWHDFVITLGTAREQSAPAMFRRARARRLLGRARPLEGRVRFGFNLLRKF